ncbi:heterogeneous nuclear ribonucleoprotein Q [Galendromus occidentalis]|uniref:Heterogeneous nuclear ribonucleoprotein Q n=1 Tax=Galendromus occidentalis TaxID=34638 RepID=A0AAJ7L4G7_9ACAR|nr:heterogeneous nuclear ribonucleoprotein Q [Galendromus occidentalis]
MRPPQQGEQDPSVNALSAITLQKIAVFDTPTTVTRSPDYQKLIGHGLHQVVATQLDDIFKTGKLSYSDLDERALDALKEFPQEGALAVLKQFLDSSLEHVSNKSAFLCGVMKTYRQKSKMPNVTTENAVKGPDQDKIKAILDRTGYALDVTTGQRKYGGPPPDFDGPTPAAGCEVFVGKIPKDMFEDELIPLFEKCGKIYDLRLMMDPLTGLNRGYAFITFCEKQGAQEAVNMFDNHEIRKGKHIGVTISINNHRLFVGNIPKNRGRDELLEEFTKHAPGLTDVIIYTSPDDKKKNRGFCFLEYESHKAASLAKRRLSTGRIKVWGCDIIVDWADPQEEPDSETMSKVKVLYVRNLTQEVTEEKLKEVFEEFGGRVERVKKIRDYAFVHFEDREDALRALEKNNNREAGGAPMEVSLAKPPSDKKKREEILRNRERRIMQMLHSRAMFGNDYRMHLLPPAHILRGGNGGGPRGRAPLPIRPYGGDFYNYGGYNGGNGYGPGAEFYDDYYNYPDYYDYSTSHGGRGRGNDGRVRKSNNGNSQIHQQQNQISKAKGQPSS